MHTAAEFTAAADQLEIECDAACRVQRAAEAQVNRSRTLANRIAFAVAINVAGELSDACRFARDLGDRLARREARAARIAERAAIAPVQADLF